MKSISIRVLFLTLLSVSIMISGCSQHSHVIEKLSDAQTATIGVMIGSTGENIARQRFPQGDIKHYDDIMDAFMALKGGKIDAIITSYVTANQLCKKNPEFHLLSEELSKESVAVAVKKGDTLLLQTASSLIGELEANGTLADMRKRWIDNTGNSYQEHEFALPNSGDALRIGVSATREPMSFVDKNGEVTGFDGELARRLAAKLNKPVKFYDMKFMALIPALQSGKIDAIISNVIASEERKKKVDFSRPYFLMPQVMLVKKAAQ
ncbi:MAG: transporter substrate-binding domain-containing protein [Chlorobium sp.]